MTKSHREIAAEFLARSDVRMPGEADDLKATFAGNRAAVRLVNEWESTAYRLEDELITTMTAQAAVARASRLLTDAMEKGLDFAHAARGLAQAGDDAAKAAEKHSEHARRLVQLARAITEAVEDTQA